MSREYKNDGRDQFNVENARDIHIGEQRSRKRPDRELKWLRAFEKEIAGRLTTSLHNQILINLGKEIELDQVRRLWDMEVKSGQITEAIAPETEILDVFDRTDIQGKLLILGKPGAGKTTTLLELARSLVKKALDDPSAPMPILLNLSSWKDPRQSLKDWTIAELTTKGIGSKISAKWLDDQKLLPLFDGLDEVRSDLQPACVKAINQFLSGEGKPEAIVVCSRREEYELYSEKLDLNGAIYLQELSDMQIETYLGKVDRLSLWEVLGADADLLELVRQPLLLSITLIAYRKELAERWQALQTTQARLEFLLDAYIERMLHRESNSRMYAGKKEPTAKQTLSWLIFLAQGLGEQSQTEFLIERIQPQNLRKKLHQWQYWLLLFSIASLCTGLIIVINLLPYWQPPSSLEGLALTQRILWRILTFGLFGGFIAATESKADGARLVAFPFVAFFCWLLRRKLSNKFRRHIPILHDINLSFKLRITIPSIQVVIQDCIEPLRLESMVFGNLFFMPLSPLIVLIHGILIIMSYCFKLNKVNRILRRNLRKVNRISYLLIKANHESPYSHHFLLIGLAIGYLTLLRSKGQLWLNTLFNLVVLLLAFFHFSLLFPFYLIPLLFSQQIDKINTPNQGSYEGLKTVLFVAVFQSIYLYLLLDQYSGHFLRQRLKPSFHRWYLLQ